MHAHSSQHWMETNHSPRPSLGRLVFAAVAVVVVVVVADGVVVVVVPFSVAPSQFDVADPVVCLPPPVDVAAPVSVEQPIALLVPPAAAILAFFVICR